MHQSYRDKYDVFICHAYEDKDAVARPLASALQAAGVRVWFDELILTPGDSLYLSISAGLKKCDYGVVVISPSFFEKEWPLRELAALLSKESLTNKVIIPVWHNVEVEDVKVADPILADRVAVKSNLGIGAVAKAVLTVVRDSNRQTTDLSGTWHGPTGKLLIHALGAIVRGDYEWDGPGWAGELYGLRDGRIVTFGWCWRRRYICGKGYFAVDDDGQWLRGEWFFENEEMIISHDGVPGDPGRAWRFARSH